MKNLQLAECRVQAACISLKIPGKKQQNKNLSDSSPLYKPI